MSFSLVQGSIHGFKFEDQNKDGVYRPQFDHDPGAPEAFETPWEGFIFELYSDANRDGEIDGGDQMVRREVTNENGEFWFDNIDPGYYVVREVGPDAAAHIQSEILPSDKAGLPS